jgi:hypothetical protein
VNAQDWLVAIGIVLFICFSGCIYYLCVMAGAFNSQKRLLGEIRDLLHFRHRSDG